MRNAIGWVRREEDGTKFKVQAWLFAGDLRWESQRARFERWEPHIPDIADWDQLEESVSKRIARGLLEQEDLQLVRKMRPD